MIASNNSFQWRDLSTQTLENPDGAVLAGCDSGVLVETEGRGLTGGGMDTYCTLICRIPLCWKFSVLCGGKLGETS